MPTITTAETLCGPRPAPHTMAFLRWVDEYISRRKRTCQRRRTTVRYVDPSLTTGANDGTTPANAWRPTSGWTATLPMDSVRTFLAGSSGDCRILFRRGTTTWDTVGIDLTKPDVYFGSYGLHPSDGLTPDKPIISHFTIRWGSGGDRFTLASGDRYTTTVAKASFNLGNLTAGIAMVRVVDDPLNPLTAVASSTECETTPFSFWSTGTTLHINLGGVDPNTVTIEAVPIQASPPSGIKISNGSSGAWIDGLRFDGWGCGARGLTITSASAGNPNGNESGIVNVAGGSAADAEHVALITGCESYYNGSHAFSQESAGIGGTHIVEGCMAGLDWNGTNGETLYNCYSATGQMECVFRDCVARFAGCPQTIISARSITAGTVVSPIRGKAFYGHVGTTNGANLYLNINCRIIDDRDLNNRATTYSEGWSFSEGADSLFLGTSSENIASLRAFVIGWKGPRIRYTGAWSGSFAPVDFSVGRMVFINSHFYLRKTWNYQNPDTLMNDFRCPAINCIFEFDDEVGDRTVMFPQSTAFAAGPRVINGMIIARGAMQTNNSEDQFQIGDANGDDRIRLANTLLISVDRLMDPTNGRQISLSRNTFSSHLKNDPASLRYLAIAGCRLTTTSPFLGFSAATGLVNLETTNNTYPDLESMMHYSTRLANSVVASGYTLDTASPLAGAGAAVPFADKSDMCPAPEYDFFGRRRPTVPAIGPFDVLNISTGGGGGGGSSGTQGIVYSPVRGASLGG